MFANLTYQDKQAFFSLLDEYFESRPHLVGSAGGSTQQTSASPVAQLQTLSRFLSPPPSASSPGNQQSPSPGPPKTEAELAREAKEKEKEAQRIELVSKYAEKGIKSSANGARASIGFISRNGTAMGVLDKYGAGGLVRGANGMVNPPKDPNANTGADAGASGKGAPPAPPQKKGGVSGLISGKSFGHVDTSSKMGAFTSMWKDPQKAQAPVVEHRASPSLASPRTNLPPPPRRNDSASTPPVVAAVAVEEEVYSAESQAQAIYDYTGADTGDLSIQTGQIVNVIEKTSADWWTCEDGNGRTGLVPSNYLKEI